MVKLLRIGICDDNLIFASKIETLLMSISKKRLIDMYIEVYSDGCELWRDISEGAIFDILYLDIEMIQINGIDVARRIRENDKDVIIIFISNYDNYLIDLFEVEPFRFIKKPVKEELFVNYFMKAYERILQDETYFEYRFNKIPYKILTKNIIYFESYGRIIKVKYVNGEGKFYGKLSFVENQLQLGKIPFLRIHQSYLVNYKFVNKISFSNVVLMDGTELKISEDRQKAIRMKYNELLGGEFFDE